MAIPRIMHGSRVGFDPSMATRGKLLSVHGAYCCRYVQPSKWLPFVKPQGFLDIWMVVTEIWYWIYWRNPFTACWWWLTMVPSEKDLDKLTSSSSAVESIQWLGSSNQSQERKWWRRAPSTAKNKISPLSFQRDDTQLLGRNCDQNFLRANCFTTSWEIMITWAPWPSPQQPVCTNLM